MDKRKVKEAKDAKLKASGGDKKKDRVRLMGGERRRGETRPDGPTRRLPAPPSHLCPTTTPVSLPLTGRRGQGEGRDRRDPQPERPSGRQGRQKGRRRRRRRGQGGRAGRAKGPPAAQGTQEGRVRLLPGRPGPAVLRVGFRFRGRGPGFQAGREGRHQPGEGRREAQRERERTEKKRRALLPRSPACHPPLSFPPHRRLFPVP